MKKRGQAAMEFLMTYGWAILAVLISIAALAYFGVLNPSRFLPESCTLFPGIACTDFKVTNGEVVMTMQNGLGQSLNPFVVTVNGCGSESLNNGFLDGEKRIISISCIAPNYPLQTGSKFRNDMSITYTSGSLSHTRTGSIISQVGSNYLRNGDFESDGANDNTIVDYWFCSPSEVTNYNIYNQDAASGKYSLRHQSVATLNDFCLSNIGGSIVDFVPYTAGKAYTVCGSFKLVSGSVNPGTTIFAILAYGVSPTYTLLDSSPQSPVIGTPTTNWQRVCSTRTLYPGGTANLRVVVYANSNPAAAGTIVLVDDVSLT